MFTLLANCFPTIGEKHFYFLHVLAFYSCSGAFGDSSPFLVPSMELEMEIQLPYFQGVSFIGKKKKYAF